MQVKLMFKNLLCLNIFIGIVALTSLSVSATSSKDSIRVVKGQVSDYYITVHEEYLLEGTVRDENGEPLKGATVMFFASPCHVNTDDNGHYELRATDENLHIYVYYPGKAFANVMRDASQHHLDITLKPDTSVPVRRRAAIATPWYTPGDDATTTYCNPMNISYNYEPYNDNAKNGGSFRSTADPMGLMFKGKNLLFSTNEGGYYQSSNLSDWEFVRASFQRYPTDDDCCAPAAFVSGDTLFYTGSTYAGLPIWYTTNPERGKWLRAIECSKLPSWDPGFLLDDDGKLYLYYGSSNEFPLKGVQLSRDDFSPIGKIHDVIKLEPKLHGWERFGMNNDDEVTLAPFTEGAYMTKHNGKTYLQYGAPGTEFKIYADGVYVADSPLGPFRYQKHNPMSYKPGGFVQGVGHGGTWCDEKGNYWHVGTCMLSIKYKFERRIGLYPTAFDRDGVMWCNTAFGDYPNHNGQAKVDDHTNRFTGWMLLSYGKKVEMSSTAAKPDNVPFTPIEFKASNLCDEDMRTVWSAETGNAGEWIAMDLGHECAVKAIQLNFYDNGTVQHQRASDLYYQYRIYASNDGKAWSLVVDKSNNDKDVPHDYVELRQDLNTRYIKVENLHMPGMGKFCMSDLRVFGKADVAAPAMVKGLKVNRDNADRRNAMISWKSAERAYGYNIRYGIAPDKLYHTITVNGACEYDLRGLDLGTDYYFAIEALGEGGVSQLSNILTVNK